MSEFDFTEDEKYMLEHVFANGGDDYAFYPSMGGDDYEVLSSLRKRGFVEAYGDYGEIRIASTELREWVKANWSNE